MLLSCSKDQPVYKATEKTNPYTLYNEGYDAFEINDFFNASKKFSEAEINFENIDLAAKSAIMSCFSLYGINFYDEALDSIERFINTYPSDKNLIYVEYLKAVIFFEQMSDEKKDIEPLLNASKQIEIFLDKYPNSDYAIDLRFKRNLIVNQLAAKELYIAKYYISVQKWIPAINRLKTIVNKYDKTIFIEEALHRLVEIHYYLGLKKEAEKYAKILGYNYNSSQWYQQSYKILNKKYVLKQTKKKDSKKNNENIIKKIIKMIK
tara:strand:+ start:3038 stop:3829 length:792 start_codon:yes stop_codon:yes gene_type:complete